MKKSLVIAAIALHGFLFATAVKDTKPPAKPEKIYAVMITGKDDFHRLLAEKSIASFLQQTYPNKHLIIVNDGSYSFGNINKELITEIKLDKKYILGELRNIGIRSIPQHGVYLQWDDDDWHHPELMEEQYKYMTSKNVDGCLLKREVTYCFKINAAWISAPQIGKIGTIMCRLNGDVFYPAGLAKAEDDIFLINYKKKYKVAIWDNPGYYYLRFVHGHNTWDDEHFNISKLKKNVWTISKKDREYLAKIVPLYDALQTAVRAKK